MSFHTSDPSVLLEQAFERIHRERMTGIDLVNPALSVAAVGFARHGDDWRGVLLTPWGIRLMLLPAVADWPVPGLHERAFRTYPSGSFAFLPNHEDGLGPYLACPLVHDMQPYTDQETALLTAQACLVALDVAPPPPPAPPAPPPDAPASPSRRSFFIRSAG